MTTSEVLAGCPEFTFPYHIGSRCSGAIGDEIRRMSPDRVVVIADENVLNLHGASLDALRDAVDTKIVVVPNGEQAKTASVLISVLSESIELGVTRRSVVVTFGGGAVGNLGGLVASLLFRGVRLVHLPTSTIGAFDSVLSMKRAVNSQVGKNQLGAYHRPTAVMVDTDWFKTLPAEFARGGWCEEAKNALAIDPGSIDTLRRVVVSGDSHSRWLELLQLSLGGKMRVMDDDPYERGRGLILEYGHTVGHAIEYASIASETAVPHGDAIALGMIAAARIAESMGYLDADVALLHEKLAADVGAPTRLPVDLDVRRVVSLVQSDNKRGLLPCREDEVAMVLLAGLGEAVVARPDGLPLTAVPRDLMSSIVENLVAR